MNYFDLYKLILTTISNERPDSFQKLLDLISSDEKVVKLREKSKSDADSINFLLDILENLINDGLITGRRVGVDGARYFMIGRLTTVGHLYLETIQKPTTMAKIKQYAKDEGLAPTPQNITKLLARIAWD